MVSRAELISIFGSWSYLNFLETVWVALNWITMINAFQLGKFMLCIILLEHKIQLEDLKTKLQKYEEGKEFHV